MSEDSSQNQKKNIISFIFTSIFVSLLYFYFMANLPIIFNYSDSMSYNTSWFVIMGLWLFIESFMAVVFFGDYLDLSKEIEIQKEKWVRFHLIVFLLKIFVIIFSTLAFIFISKENGLFIIPWGDVNSRSYIRIVFGFILICLFGFELIKLIISGNKSIFKERILSLCSFGFLFSLFIIGFFTYFLIFLQINLTNLPFIIAILSFVLISINFIMDYYENKEIQEKKVIKLKSPLYYANWGIILISIMLIAHGSNLIIPYQLPGDTWSILRILKTFFSPDTINFVEYKNYPSFWAILNHGLSYIFGVPAINTGTILNYYTPLSIFSIYIFGKLLFPKLKEKYHFIIMFFFFFHGSFDWLSIILDFKDPFAISGTLYYRVLSVFSYRSLYMNLAIWTMIFFFILSKQKEENNHTLTQILIFFSGSCLFFAFAVHFIELIIFLPLGILWMVSFKEIGISLKKIAMFLTFLLIYFIILNFLVGNSYFTLVFGHTKNYWDWELFRLNYNMDFSNFDTVLFCASLVFPLIFLTGEIISKIEKHIQKKQKKLSQKFFSLENKKKIEKYIKILSILIFTLLFIYILFSQMLNTFFESQIYQPGIEYYKNLVIPYFIIGIFSFSGIFLQKKKGFILKILLSFGIIIFLSLIWWGGKRTFVYLSFFMIPTSIFSISHIFTKIDLKNAIPKIKGNKKWVEKILLIFLMLSSFTTNIMCYYVFYNYDSRINLNDDGAEYLTFIEKNLDENDTLLIADTYQESIEYYSIWCMSPCKIVYKNSVLEKDPYQLSLKLKEANVTHIFLKNNTDGTWASALLDDVIIQYFDYGFVFNSSHNQYFILKLKPDNGFKGRYWEIGKEPNDCSTSDAYSWNDTVIDEWLGHDKVVRIFSEHGTASCRYNFDPKDSGVIEWIAYHQSASTWSPQFHIGSGNTYIYASNDYLFYYNGTSSHFLGNINQYEEKWTHFSFEWNNNSAKIFLDGENVFTTDFSVICSFFKAATYLPGQVVYLDNLYFLWDDELLM